MNKIMILLLTGFVAGILLAPRKGSITRRRLIDGAERLSDKLSDIFDKGQEGTENMEEELLLVPKMSTLI